MIVELYKYLIYGTKQEVNRFFELAQRAGFIEFLGDTQKRASDLPQVARTFLSAIKIAKHYETHPQNAPSLQGTAVEEAASQIVSMRQAEESLHEEERTLVAEIARVQVFGDFSQDALHRLEKDTVRKFQFFCMKSDLVENVSLPEELIYVGTDYDLDYFVSFSREEIRIPKMIEILITRPVGELRKRLSEVRTELSLLASEIRQYANLLPAFQSGFTHHLNQHLLDRAKKSVSLNLENGLFAIEAWVPKTRTESLKGLLSQLDVEAEVIAIETNDVIPTCIENRGAAKMGEDLLGIFDTPSHTDKDPSLWILTFFSLFFAMIISDAGYGTIFLLVSLYLRRRFRKVEGAAKRVLKLFTYLSCAAILWGVVTSSYFGIEFAPESPIQKVSILRYLTEKKADYTLSQKNDLYREILQTYPEAQSARTGLELLEKASRIEGGTTVYSLFEEMVDNILMEFSFLVGIFHIALSFIRYLKRHLAGIGWILFMIGGYLYLPSIIKATTLVNFMGWIPKETAYAIGAPLMLFGILVAFILAFIKKKLGALGELLHVVQIFADVLSYLRIYALALGGMVMADTFNHVLGINPGIFFSVLIILGGHVVNIAVSVMGSVVHGLRLNFLEWFRYSFEGGGRLFNPLRYHRTK